MHITVAMIVAYFVTGNLWMAVTLSLLEPTVQAFAFFFHERIWEKRTVLPKKIFLLKPYIKRPQLQRSHQVIFLLVQINNLPIHFKDRNSYKIIL